MTPERIVALTRQAENAGLLRLDIRFPRVMAGEDLPLLTFNGYELLGPWRLGTC